MKTAPVLIVGAGSDIGRAIAHRFAKEGHPLQLTAREPDTLLADKNDLILRYGVPVTVHRLDVLETGMHGQFVEHLPELPAIAVCVVGLLGRQKDDELDLDSAVVVMRSNYEGPASILGALANAFALRGSGTLIGISSVAGERGRASNYIYGSAKAGFTAYLSGMRNRLSDRGVRVITVLPGFVATKMTDDLHLPPHLTADPSEVADAIFGAVKRGRDVIYVRKIWRLIMTIIRLIPEAIFKRLKL